MYVSSGKHLFYQGLAISYTGVMRKQRHCRETTPVSTLPEIMGLRGEKKAHHCEQPFSPGHCAEQTEEEQEEYSCTQLSPGALPVGLQKVSLLQQY